MGKYIDMVGRVYGRLTILERAGVSKQHQILYRCKCACGEELTAQGDNIRNGVTASCGCYRREVTGNRARTHGKRNIPEYEVWAGIKDRCLNPRARAYRWYGGRGIKLCKRWRESFTNFYNDMGARPSKYHTIERCDNTKGYNPKNCKWLHRRFQARNKSTTIFVKWKGATRKFCDVCRELKISQQLVYDRIYILGWKVTRAFLEPKQSRRKGNRRKNFIIKK